MRVLMMKQGSPEWWDAKTGSIGGTRYGQAVSTKKNRLVYDLINERLNGYVIQDEFVSDDMQFGIDNEPEARGMYSLLSGIDFYEVGLIKSDYSIMHHASPDGLSDSGIVLEVKCTSNGEIHIQRFFEGVESSYMPQIMNYFAVSDDVKEVHWVSYCPYREERPLIYYVFKAVDYAEKIKEARIKIKAIETEVLKKEAEFIF
jgi:hypothetical protein